MQNKYGVIMKKQVYVSVSTDPIKEYHKVIEYAQSLQGVADFIHCDVKDGVFVDNKAYDAGLVNNINQNCLTMLDVHLMCSEPLKLIDDYAKAGANIITIHYEAFANKNDIVLAHNKIKEYGALAGLALKPETSVREIKMFLHDFDVILVLGVNPGASGQKFLPQTLEKIKQLASERENNDLKFKIEVDGGVNTENAEEITEAGADMLVSGAFIYKAQNREVAIQKLKK